ncbi:MAG: nitroreductase family protein [Anaerolineales bacterium]|nr:nitroreductase family protein [Anaerolineae bacterium]MBL6983351.1 nitroreductase family protein [Anaerolineales bacterium]
MNAFEAITQRQGVICYKPDPVDRDLIQRVLQAATAAPSPANTQPWELIVIDDAALTRQVAEYLVDTQAEFVFRQLLGTPEPFIEHLLKLYDEFYTTPCFIILCRNQRTELAQSEHAATVRDWDLCSIGAAMANLMAAATELGLGTRWFGNPMMDPETLHQMLGIPPEIEIIAVTPLGHHDEQPKVRPTQSLDAHTDFQRGDKYKLAALLQGKLALEDVVHFNKFGG